MLTDDGGMSRQAHPAFLDLPRIIRECARLLLVLTPFSLCLLLYVLQD
jgi:hypothetical protein